MGDFSDKSSSSCLDCSFFLDNLFSSLFLTFWLTILFFAVSSIKNKYLKLSTLFILLASVWLFLDYSIFVERESSWSTYLLSEEISYTFYHAFLPILVVSVVVLFALNYRTKTANSKILILLILLNLTFQSCENKTQKTTKTEKQKETISIPSKFKSPLRPNEKLELGKIYTDKVKYVKFDDNGDNWLVVVEKNNDTIGLIYDKDQSDFFRGEELEIQWKIDSIRYAGDPEFLNYTEFLVSSKRTESLKLTDKKVKFLWRETRYIEEWETDVNIIELNQEYINTISEPEKAVLAYIATFIGNECEWDGKANENRSNLICKILWALNLGYQCSYTHLDFLRFWFRNNKGILKELENCPTTPDGATIQDTFDEIDIEVKENKINVFFKASGINMREGKSWSWTEKHSYEFKKNEIILLKKDISPIIHDTLEVSGN